MVRRGIIASGTKSRKGCIQCKTRRIKCDEKAPCTRCVRRKEQCSLLPPSSTHQGSPRISSSGPSPHADPSDPSWLQDLALMHHYTRAGVAFGPVDVAGVDKLWPEVFPAIAVEHRFVMHGLLAFSALHLAQHKQIHASEYLMAYDSHQGRALAHFRHEILHIRPGNATATFALAILTSTSALARLAIVEDGSSRNPPHYHDIEDLISVLILARGMRDINVQGHSWIKQGPLAALLSRHGPGDNVRLSTKVARRFEQLLNRLLPGTCDGEPALLAVCSSALSTLADVYAGLPASNSHLLAARYLFRFAVQVPVEVVTALRSHHPAAVVIMAQWVILWSALSDMWCVRDFGVRALEGLSRAIPAPWLPWLDWCWEELEAGLPCLTRSGETSAA